MKAFLIGLQFLTRLKLARQDTWTDDDFGRSVKYFPLVGAVIGLILVLIYKGTAPYLPHHIGTALLLVSEAVLTGGLHLDGFMDTMDGLFSYRSSSRILEIMKDSRVGSNAVMSLGLLLLFKWSLYLDLAAVNVLPALFVMPVVSRWAMVIGVTCFPYARPKGIGKAFATFSGPYALLTASIFTGALLIPCGWMAGAAALAVAVFAVLFARLTVRRIGGLTGDIYGAITELSEIVVLIVYNLF